DRQGELFHEPRRQADAGAQEPAAAGSELFQGLGEVMGSAMAHVKLPRRKFLHLAASAAALPALSQLARAQAYPSRPVRIIVPFAPAGTTDIVARLMAQWLSERLGQQFVIENRPGGAGNPGTEAVVRASPDGYTLLSTDVSSAINATMFGKLNYNF